MPRGVAHSRELRARVVAAVLAGASVAQTARQFGVSKSLVSEWSSDVRTARTDQRARDPQALENLLLELIAAHAVTLCAELQFAAQADWLEKQSAADLAQLVVAQRDTLIRLLAGFRPAPDSSTDQPELDAPAPPETAA